MAKWNVPIVLPADPINPLEAATKQYVDTGLATKASANNAQLTGVPIAPTAAASANTTQLATTAFVKSQFQSDLTLVGSLLPGTNGLPSLGSASLMWKELYVQKLYINGQKALEDNGSGDIRLTSGTNKNVSVESVGSGDVSLSPLGSGKIKLNGSIIIDGAAVISASDGLSILFDDAIEFLPGAGIVGGLTIDGNTAWHAGNFTPSSKLDTTATAAAALKLNTARNFSLTGVITASAVGFDGTGNVALSTVIADSALTIAKTGGLQAALDAKAEKASPTLTGVPLAPTATAGTNTAQIATTAFVNTAVAAGGGGGVKFTLSDTAPTSPSSGDEWCKSSTGRKYTWIDDGTSSQWVELELADGSSITIGTTDYNYDGGTPSSIYPAISLDGGSP